MGCPIVILSPPHWLKGGTGEASSEDSKGFLGILHLQTLTQEEEGEDGGAGWEWGWCVLHPPSDQNPNLISRSGGCTVVYLPPFALLL